MINLKLQAKVYNDSNLVKWIDHYLLRKNNETLY